MQFDHPAPAGQHRSLNQSRGGNIMKFVVITRPRPVQQGMTSAMLEATLAKVNEQLKSGIIDCIYSFADGGGSVGIGNADSGEALVEGLQYAASPFLQF